MTTSLQDIAAPDHPGMKSEELSDPDMRHNYNITYQSGLPASCTFDMSGLPRTGVQSFPPPMYQTGPQQPYEGMDLSQSQKGSTYAELLSNALKQAPNHTMTIRNIYDWFLRNTDKAADKDSKSWKSTIRSNLTADPAFEKVSSGWRLTDDALATGVGWRLTDDALATGVKPTRSYRPTQPQTRESSIALSQKADKQTLVAETIKAEVKTPSKTQFAHQDSGKSREIQATGAKRRSSAVASSGTSRSRKRQRQDNDDGQYADTFSIGDVDSLKHFYTVRFRELGIKLMIDVVTAWVKILEPEPLKYGPYRRNPRWWPVDVPYIEPSHLKVQHLVPLAVDIMLIHRRIDEEVGKRRYPSWISMLKTNALDLISFKDAEHFSSSQGAKYNEAMKKRALEIILPSVFNIAKSHEEYIIQYNLYEGFGNKDPGCGKQVSWQATPRPPRRIEHRPTNNLLPDLPDGADVFPHYHETAQGPYLPYHETAQGPYLPYHETAQGPYLPYHETAQGPYLPYHETAQGPYLPYHETAQGPYSYHVPNSFATSGPVVPHDVALGGALGAHDSHMLGLPDSNHMHGLSDSRQMHGFPNSHGLPMHQVSAHDFPTHGMLLNANWTPVQWALLGTACGLYI